jgi:cysteinyl-tRNA synthetase
MKYLGETVTIHGGGQDLSFPHHDCEIAQSERFTGKPFVSYWMHTGLVALGPVKMSKSLGNMVFVSDLVERYPGDAVRLLLLSHRYRDSWEYDDAAMEAAASLQHRLAVLARQSDATTADIEEWGAPLLDALADDLDTPRAIEELTRLVESGAAGALRTARTLGRDVLGLRLES